MCSRLPWFLSGPERLVPVAASPSGPAPLPPVPPGTTLQVGVDLPWQGSLARSSQETYDAMRLYLKQVGDKAGPYPVELVKYDDSVASKGTWDEATCTANAVKHLANEREVAIVGTANSGCTKLELRALNGQATAAHPTMLMVSHANTSPGLTRPYEAGEPQIYYPQGVRNFARVVTTDDQQGGVDAGFAASIGATRCFVLDDTTAVRKVDRGRVRRRGAGPGRHRRRPGPLAEVLGDLRGPVHPGQGGRGELRVPGRRLPQQRRAADQGQGRRARAQHRCGQA